MRVSAAWLVLLALLAPYPSAWADSSMPPQGAVDLQVMARPHAVPTGARTRFIYELHLANTGDSPVRLRRLEVVDDSDGRVVATFAGSALEDRFSSTPAGGGHAPVLAPQSHGVVYLEWIADARRPRVLAHVLTYVAEPGVQVSSRGGRTPVSYAAGTPLGPPLRGGPWIAIHDAGWPKGHRRVFTRVGDKARIPGRFAIDWVRVDENGRFTHGDPDVPADALGYGAPVLAVADATVAVVRDGMPEAARVSANPPHALPDEAGNYVVLRLADGRYAFYEHLRPGSTTVKPGQRVRRGDVLGALGFTGSSTGPHLHLHVADGPSPIGAEGLPFVFDGFDLLGRYTDPAKLGSAPWSPPGNGASTHRADEWPEENAVVRFPE